MISGFYSKAKDTMRGMDGIDGIIEREGEMNTMTNVYDKERSKREVELINAIG